MLHLKFARLFGRPFSRPSVRRLPFRKPVGLRLELERLEDRTVPSTLLGPTANSFAVLGASTVTNTGPTIVGGNLGVSPGAAITGFPPGLVLAPGTIHAADAVALQAQTEVTTAFNVLAALPPNASLTGQDLGGLTLTPGVYNFATSAQLTGTLTLDGQGDPNARFVFQIGSTLTTASSSRVIFVNGAQDDEVYWQVGSSATLGTSTQFAGNIVALTSITLNTNASIVCGRALARNGAVTLDSNVVSTTCGSISGTKFNDLNGDGIRQPGEPALPGVTLFLDANNNGVLDPGEASTISDASGNYTFGNLVAGTYRVREMSQVGLSQTTPNPADITLSSGQDVGGVNFGDFRLISIGGGKFNDLNGDGVREPGEPGLAGIRVFLDTNGNGALDPGEVSTTTDASGNFTFTNIGPGTFRVREVLPAGSTQTSANPPNFVTSSGSNITGVLFGNFQLISIGGIKFNDLNGDGVREPGEPGLAGITIFLDTNGNGTLDPGERFTATDASGNFSFTNIGPGTFRVREVPRPGFAQTTPNPADVVTSSGGNIAGILIGNVHASPRLFTAALGQGGVAGAVTLTDSATLSGGFNATGLIAFTVTWPDASVHAVGSVAVNGDGTYTSPAFVPSLVGTYTWTATYSGDVFNNGAIDQGGPAETAGLFNWPTAIVSDGGAFTVDSRGLPHATAGTSVHDTALPDIAAGADLPFPVTGTLTFTFFRADVNGNPIGAPISTQVVPPVGTATFTTSVSSASTGPLGAGSYAYVVTYSGDRNYRGGTSAAEPLIVNNILAISGGPAPVAPGQVALFNGISKTQLFGSNLNAMLTDPVVVPAAGGPNVWVFDSNTGALQFSITAYDPNFGGGVRTAIGDVNGDGVADIITGPGPGGGPDIHVYDGRTGAMIRQFFAFNPNFTGGVFVAAGDVNGDGFADISVGADAGGGPNVMVFNGKDGAMLDNFFAYDPGFTGGVRVAAGDLTGNGRADIITGAGPGGGPNVKVFRASDLALLQSFFAYDAAFTGGVYVAAGDTSGTGKMNIVTGAGAGGGPNVAVFNGGDVAMLQSFFAFDPAFLGGVRVATVGGNGGGKATIFAVAGPGNSAGARFNGLTAAAIDPFFAANPGMTDGIFAGGGQ
jgi:hypothetical protein